VSDQTLDLKKSMSIVRRHWISVAVFFVLGLIAGASYTVLRPPMFSSSALVVLPTSVKDVATQVVVADSQDVLTGALRGADLGVTWPALRKQVDVKELTPNIISFAATGKTATEAQKVANDVARSYIAYVSNRKSVVRNVTASLLQPAVSGTRTPVPVRLATTAVIGALAGILVGAIYVLAMNRSDRRPRMRDEIAGTVGVPVLASLPVAYPKDSAAWVGLLENYRPDVVHSWRLYNAIRYIFFDTGSLRGEGNSSHSVTVLSLSADRRALALGPQLAAFAASTGISTALVIGPQQDAASTAVLRSACAVHAPSSKRSSRLQVAVVDQPGAGRPSDVELTVVVAVVDSRAPQTAEMIRTGTTLLGVSAGVATAEELARVAAEAAGDGRDIEGILVADPEVSDHTTGLLPQVVRRGQRSMPTRLTSMMTEGRG
jgi:capsular polysaccharide biosynthesis protein